MTHSAAAQHAGNTSPTLPQITGRSSTAAVRGSSRRASDDSDSGVQLTLDDALAAGQAGMAQATDAAERKDPLFRERAEAAMVAHLSTRPGRSAPGEELVDVATAAGVTAPDARAFGSVFASMARRGVIRCIGYCARRKGHMGAGGRVWSLNV